MSNKSFKILVIGDACTDVYVFGKCTRLSPESPVPILRVSREERRQGMASNVARNLEGLGHDVDLICNKEYIEKRRLVDENYFHHLLRVDREPFVQPVNIKKFKDIDKLKIYDAFVISDYCKGFIDYESCKKIVNIISSLKKPIFVDSKKRDISCFSNCIVKINESEYKNTTRIPKNSDVIVTLGKRGAMWNDILFSSHESEIDKLFEKANHQSLRMANVCGAGDTFFSGLIDKYMQTNGDMETSLKFANKCASICIDNFGTYAIKRKDIK